MYQPLIWQFQHPIRKHVLPTMTIKISFTLKTKIGRHDLEQYYEDFKKRSTCDLKDKTSTACVLCTETIWHVKNSTSHYSRLLQRKSLVRQLM